MPTLLQNISLFIDKISVTDRQEENINNSIANLEYNLKKDGTLSIKSTFTTGSWERDTIIRPLNDVDLFAVLKRENWLDEYGNLKSPQAVLSKIKNHLNSCSDYKDKVKQDRPCVTVELSDKSFDILPSFEIPGTGGYFIPNYDLQSWTTSYPEKLTSDLNSVHKLRNYRVKQIIKTVKHWNRAHNKLIPSYHIEESAISIFNIYNFVNSEEGIRKWFNEGGLFLNVTKFKSIDDHTITIKRLGKAKEKINDAFKKYEAGKEGEANQLWKDIFGDEFPTIDVDEAKVFSKALSDGSLKIASTGTLSTSEGSTISASKGFFGGVSKE
jgi:hypothetical protein